MLEISKLMLTDMHSFDIDNACCVDEAFKKQATGERGNNLQTNKKSASKQLGKA